MKGKINFQKLTLVIFFLLFIAGAIEILSYFNFIYRPASFIAGKSPPLRLEIPAVSQLLNSQQTTDESVSLADFPRTFQSDNLENFREGITAKLSTHNTFVKSSKIDMIVAGDIAEIAKGSGGNLSLKLKNTSGNTASETFSADEFKNIKLNIITLSPDAPKREEGTLGNLLTGDYIIIKTSTSLFERGSVIKKEIEVFRKPLSN